MDEVLNQFEGASITPREDIESKTQFEELYKNWGRLGNQEERRRQILEVQKSNRNNKIDRFRGILELVNAVEENEIFKMQKRVYYKPTIYVAGFNKASATYSNVLMMSEWMIEKPADFCENWYVVPCPKGVRMLVVANQGSTKCYTKYGSFRYQMQTGLPGGNRSDSRNKCCVLDCFYAEKINTMFILDLLAWNSQPMTDGETEFRQYWLQTQLAEYPNLHKVNKRNETVFKILPKVSCQPESFNEFMMQLPQFEHNCPELDGLLFYHKTAHYFSGETPLVGWLFPYMVLEVIGPDTKIHPGYMALKPVDYVNQTEFIQKFEAKYNKKDNRSRKSSSSMDTADTESTKSTESRKTKNKKNKTTEVMDAEEVESENNGDNKEVMDAEEFKTQNNGDNKEVMDAEEMKPQNNGDNKEVMNAEEVKPQNHGDNKEVMEAEEMKPESNGDNKEVNVEKIDENLTMGDQNVPNFQSSEEKEK